MEVEPSRPVRQHFVNSESSITLAGDLSKPATALIEKISDAIGGVFKPYQIVRVAKAEAEADRLHAESQIEVTDLHRRALRRFLEEEAKKQANIEAIAAGAIPLLNDDSSPEDLEDDWITNFFDKSRIVSDHEMQSLWSRILAGEANAPGKFARRTVNLLADLEKSDAALFTQLCGFGWLVGEINPIVLGNRNTIYRQHGIAFDSLVHLDSLGLIRFNSSGFQRTELPQHLTVAYFGRQLDLAFRKEANNTLTMGDVLITRAGQELAKVCQPVAVEGFFDYVREKWSAECEVAEPNGESDTQNGA